MKKIIVWILAVLLSFDVYAQNARIDDLGNGLSYKTISTELKNIEKLTKDEKTDVNSLVDKITYLNDTFGHLTSSRQIIASEIKLIEKRIEALGENDDGAVEAKIIMQKRQEFKQELTTEKTRL